MRAGFLILSFVLFGFNVAGQEKFNFTFETASTLPKFHTYGTEYEIHENPEGSDLNPSLLVGRVNKKPGKSISWSGVVMQLPTEVNLNNGGYLKMKVFSADRKGKVQVKFETEPQTINAYSSTRLGKLNEWQELVFRFKPRNYSFTKLSIAFDLGRVDENIFYFDDITWVEGKRYDNQSQ